MENSLEISSIKFNEMSKKWARFASQNYKIVQRLNCKSSRRQWERFMNFNASRSSSILRCKCISLLISLWPSPTSFAQILPCRWCWWHFNEVRRDSRLLWLRRYDFTNIRFYYVECNIETQETVKYLNVL